MKLTKNHDVIVTDKVAVEGSTACQLTLEAVLYSAVELLSIGSKMECIDVDAAFNSALKQMKEFGNGVPRLSSEEEKSVLKVIQVDRCV